MENRIAVISIIVENLESAAKINEILHQHAAYIIGRLGIPYRDKKINVISVILDAPTDVVSALSGKLGMLPDVSVKAVYGKN